MSDQIFSATELDVPIRLESPRGEVVLLTRTAPGKTTGNEDAAGYWPIGEDECVLAVADGLGGCPAGAEAAAIAIHCLGESVRAEDPLDSLRSRILDAFEEANRRVLAQGIGSGTTLVAAEVTGGVARVYHAGDSGALIVGQRGRVRFETIPHSPVGYGVAAGILDPGDIHHHDERHLLSNCIGSREMRVELGAPIRMARHDTLLLATDGVLDNVRRERLVETIRKGPGLQALGALQEQIARTMNGEDPELPAHPDDATALLLRPGRT